MAKLFSTATLPRAIVHLDGDSFFASIEQNLNHELKGKPVVTGGERGAATSMSYEAKRLGIHRGMTMKEIRAVCPQAIIVPSDYTAYSIYAHRMYSIVRRFTPDVEEYSIDECFADITGLRRQYRMPYEKIALMIKETLESELGVTFGVGLAPNKVLAKVASKYRKPSGFTVIYGRTIHEFLPNIPIGDVWGIGRSTTFFLQKIGLRTAYDFAIKDEAWFERNHLSKPFKELWLELNGKFIKPLATTPSRDIGSIIKSRTFTPPSQDRSFILSQLSKNIEAACAKARRYNMLVREITFYLKTQEFKYRSFETRLPVPTTDSTLILQEIQKHFDRVFLPNIQYRATGITLRSLLPEEYLSHDLFGNVETEEGKQPLLHAIDKVNRKYGRETLHLCSSHKAIFYKEPTRKEVSKRPKFTLAPDQRYKTIDIPYLGLVI